MLGTPSVIFLDEPSTGLDPQGRLAMRKIIKDLTKTGITVFLTTQYLEEADELADQIAILNEGKIMAEGTAAELKKQFPNRHIELKFSKEKELQSADDLLNEYNRSLDGENLTLSISTDCSIKQITDILNRLENAGVSVTEFTHKLPTLEAVFHDMGSGYVWFIGK